MILWTIQPVEIYKLIQQQGYYVCQPDKSECLKEFGFKDAYNWLVQKMKEKIGEPPNDVEYPVWAWHTWNWKNKKPDLRVPRGKRGEELVCMEIEIPDKDVVLSDFDSWHYVLNNWHHNYAKNEEEWDQLEDWIDSLPEEEKQKEIIKSWDNIFNINPINDQWIIQGQNIQATFWKLEKCQIRKIQYFKSR